MKTKNFLILFLFIFLSQASIAQQKIFYDFKTKLSEKFQLTHIKNSTELLIIDSDFASVSELVADYALWLKNYRKTQDQNVFTVKLDIEIREPKIFGEGKLMLKDSVKVIYVIGIRNEYAENHYELFKQRFDNWSEEILAETSEVSCRLFNKIKQMTWELYYR